MLFNAPEFVFVFLPVAVAGFFLLGISGVRPAAIAWLTLLSLFFYAYGTAAHVALIVGSILFNYGTGRLIEAYRRRSQDRSAQLAMIAGVVVNLAALGYFKYANFFAENLAALTGDDFITRELVLPLAISFFTLQQIAYLVDVRRGLTDEHRLLDYALFVSFFPQLIAGPIVHHKEMLPQFRASTKIRPNWNDIAAGASLFFLGLFKKVAIADTLGLFTVPVFDAAAGGASPGFFAAWGGALAFTFEIYFDFSAYSDMAIGLALMMSIRLPMNFDSPYRASSIIEFWRRWHMTLSRFLRDYLYFSLGGNRRGKIRRHLNLMLTMLIGGLWHGASWLFVIWGGLHGLYLMINHFWRSLFRANPSEGSRFPRAGRFCGWLVTFLAVAVAWVFFRAENLGAAERIIAGMAGLNGAFLPTQLIELFPLLGQIVTAAPAIPHFGYGTVLGLVEFCILLVVCFAAVLGFRNLHRISQRRRLVLVALTLIVTIRMVVFGDAQEFIYFRF